MTCCFATIIIFLMLSLPSLGFGQIKVRGAYGTPSLSQVVFPLGVQAGMFERQRLNMGPVYTAGRSINLEPRASAVDPVKLHAVVPQNFLPATARHFLMEKLLRCFGEIGVAVRVVR